MPGRHGPSRRLSPARGGVGRTSPARRRGMRGHARRGGDARSRRAVTAAPSPRWRRAWRGGCKRRARRSTPIWRGRRRSSTTSPRAVGDHAEAGAALVREFGFPELAAPVARHMSSPSTPGGSTRARSSTSPTSSSRARRAFRWRRASRRRSTASPAIPSALAGVRRRLASARAISERDRGAHRAVAFDDGAALAQPTGGGSWPAAIAV